VNGYKALFISDPDRVAKDTLELRNFYNSEDEELVRNIMNRKLTPMATLGELFSTHPNIVKRLKALNI
jgi:Zn-dependent protease with chaperone function